MAFTFNPIIRFSEKNETSYRPTNDDCLMRTVTSPNFCKACTEGLWLSLLRRVDLIDGIREDCQRHLSSASLSENPPNGPGEGKWVKTLDLDLIPLAHHRNRADETYTITGRKDTVLLAQFTNQTRLEIDATEALGSYFVDVRFATGEIRLDKDDLLSSSIEYTIRDTCEPRILAR